MRAVQGHGELADGERASVSKPDQRIGEPRPHPLEATLDVDLLDLGVHQRKKLVQRVPGIE
ncbi:hypothetical protein GCM10010412_065890 [Nonomuraea recticatena]|uniref:Uncharacterized protein n=1 Tax=Nonomuraea recticatena TaxID=46178 RepID=A0ABP6F324_9ACTN